MVTAVVTTHKREPEIVVRAVKSILNQTYTELEIIVVDDSPESYALRSEVKAQVLELDSRIQYIQHEENKGVSQARNTGLFAANGEYIAYLDDDDEWNPEKIRKQLSVFENGSPDIALVYCGSVYVNQLTKTSTVKSVEKHSGYIFGELIKNNFIGGTSCPVMRTSFLKEIGGFDVLMPTAEDADVWLRLAAKYKVEYVDEPLYTYYEVHAGEQLSTNAKKKLAGVKALYEKNSKYLKEHPAADWELSGKLAFLNSWAGDFKQGMKLWWKAVCLKPFWIIGNIGWLLRVFQKYFFYVKKTKKK